MSSALRRLLERLPVAAPLARRAVSAAGCELRIAPDAVDVRRGEQVVRLAPRHFLFAPDVAAHFDAYWATVGPGEANQMRDFSQPARHFVPALGVHLWQSGLMEEVDTIQGYLAHAPPRLGETVFDLGSNCGASVLVFARAVGPGGHVVAFEPDPLNREMLRRSIEQLALANVEVHDAAVAGRTGRLRSTPRAASGPRSRTSSRAPGLPRRLK